MYLPGMGGRFPISLMRKGMLSPETTFCNQAAFDTANALGFNRQALYGNGSRDDFNANGAARNLASAASSGLIQEITGEQAQAMANEGYVVIAAWEKVDGIGHLATVRPITDGTLYNNDAGPLLSNVGSDIGILSTSDVFRNVYKNLDTRGQIHFYYDRNQEFNYDLTDVARVME
jgi:hypothetical protein